MFDCYQNIAIISPEENKKGEMWRFISGWSHAAKDCPNHLAPLAGGKLCDSAYA